VVAKTEQNADDDTSLNMNPSTGNGMASKHTDPNTHTGMSIIGNGNLHILVPTYTSQYSAQRRACWQMAKK
jgi:hypothetical protein